VYCERAAEKVISGSNVKALPRYSDKSLKELKSPRGDRVVIRSKPPVGCNGLLPGLTPCRRREIITGTGGATHYEENLTNVMRAWVADEAGQLGSRENP
jgi:hypothetical protein